MKKKVLVAPKKILGFLSLISCLFLTSSFSFAQGEAPGEHALYQGAKFYSGKCISSTSYDAQELIKATREYYNYLNRYLSKKNSIFFGFRSGLKRRAQAVEEVYRKILKVEISVANQGENLDFSEEFQSLQRDYQKWKSLHSSYAQVLSVG